MTKKTEIEFELSETVAYSRRGERLEAFCPRCKKFVEMATPQIAAILARTSEREVFRQVESGEVHFVETDRVLVCLNLLKQDQKEILEP
jgi:phage FluMu protein Com